MTKACWYDPELYLELARHYGTVVLPTRAPHPRDKGVLALAGRIASAWARQKGFGRHLPGSPVSDWPATAGRFDAGLRLRRFGALRTLAGEEQCDERRCAKERQSGHP